MSDKIVVDARTGEVIEKEDAVNGGVILRGEDAEKFMKERKANANKQRTEQETKDR